MKRVVLLMFILLVIASITYTAVDSFYIWYTQDKAGAMNFIGLHGDDSDNEENDGTVNIVAVGDIMLDRGVENKVKKVFGGDYKVLFKNVYGYFREKDIVFGNLEGPASDKGKDMGGKFSFNMQPETIDVLKWAGFDVLSLANNHILDWGYESLCDTYSRVVDSGMYAVGAGCDKKQANDPVIVEKNGIRVAFAGFVDMSPYPWGVAKENMPGVSDASESNIVETIEKSEGMADVVIVSVHWGDEYKPYSSKSQRDLAKKIVDAGADLVIGHHPHVDQEIVKMGDSFVVYSLGNFVFDQSWSEETMESFFIEAQISKDGVDWVKAIPYKLNENFQVEL